MYRTYSQKNWLALPLFALLICLNTQSLNAQSLFDSLYDVRSFDVHFASGKADLDARAQSILDSALFMLQGINGEKTVRITAHTDSIGNLDFNETLSLRRAQSVSKWLIGKGLKESSIIAVKVFGERSPIHSNHTEAGRQLNRSATVEIARSVPMSRLEGRVTDKTTGEGIETNVTFQSKSRKDSVRTDSLGWYRVNLPKDSIVKIEVVEKNYFFESVTLKIFGSPELYRQYKLSPDIVLPPAKPGETVVLRNFYFIGNEARLVKASEPELPKILKFMQLNPDLKIEIGGHVNLPYDEKHAFPLKPGQTAADFIMARAEPEIQQLSAKRAETLYQYLLKNGIEASRMTTKGYRNTKMLYPYTGCSSLQQQQNRRVEITVTGRVGE